jgi:prephenate dehydrogenase
VAAAALVTLLNQSGGDMESCIKLIGGGFKDTTRIASSNADMWADICMTNGKAIAANLRTLQEIIGSVITACENQDRQAVYDYFTASKKRRDALLENAQNKFDPN